jgi:hypothetical protein
LEQLAEYLEKKHKGEGAWSFTYDFLETRVAIETRLFNEWETLTQEQREKAVAYWLTNIKMKNWEDHIQEKKIKDASKKGAK